MASPGTFGPFSLDSERGRLLRDGIAVPLGQRAIAVLEALLESRGKTVTKEDLIARAWQDTVVEDGNLTVQIAALRKALGPATDGIDWIVTVPRVGYRLIADGTRDATERGDAGLPMLAVLPFQNLGGDTEQDWFADGVVDDIITALSRFRSFTVIARNSSFSYKGRNVDVRQVAQDLDVRYVLEGSVRRAGDRLRITAQLVDATTGAHLWAEHLDGILEDVFAFQDFITERVATLVAPQIQAAEIARSRRDRPGSFTAYDIYLQALAKIESAECNAEAYELLNSALALEPDNPILLAYASFALEHRSTSGWPPLGPDDRQRSAELARRGLQNAGGDPAVMARCGMSLLLAGRDYDRGMAAIQSAAQANPNDATVTVIAGVAHIFFGDLDEALAYFHRANRLGLDSSLTGIAHAHLIAGNDAEALAWAARAVAVKPGFNPALFVLIAANARLDRLDEARRLLRELQRVAPGATLTSIRAGLPDRIPARVAPILDGLRLAGLPDA